MTQLSTDALLNPVCEFADNVLEHGRNLYARFQGGFFTHRDIALVDDPTPLALLHLSAAMEGRREQIPVPCR